MTGPCEWPVSYASCPDPSRSSGDLDLEPLALDDGAAALVAEPGEAPPSGREQFESAAVNYLWHWTGQQFGLCPATVRPCLSAPAPAYSTFSGRGPYGRIPGSRPQTPARLAALRDPVSCGTCASACSCGSPYAISLPGPVDSIVSVTIDGEVLPPSAYRIDAHSWLVRLDGEAWPASQDLLAQPGEPDTFVVDYLRGTPVPEGGQIAAGVLANELWKAACGASDCALPQRLQSITRQGVSVTILDSFEGLGEGFTGIWLIDSWIASVTRPVRPSRVTSVDVAPKRVSRSTWPL